MRTRRGIVRDQPGGNRRQGRRSFNFVCVRCSMLIPIVESYGGFAQSFTLSIANRPPLLARSVNGVEESLTRALDPDRLLHVDPAPPPTDQPGNTPQTGGPAFLRADDDLRPFGTNQKDPIEHFYQVFQTRIAAITGFAQNASFAHWCESSPLFYCRSVRLPYFEPTSQVAVLSRWERCLKASHGPYRSEESVPGYRCRADGFRCWAHECRTNSR